MRFVAGGTGRCGTVWFRHALERVGLWVTHETMFTHEYRPVEGPDGEVSAAAAAWRHEIPEWWPILHMVRDPLLVIRSFLDLDSFGTHHTLPSAEALAFRYAHTTVDPTADRFTQTVRYVLDWDNLWTDFGTSHPYAIARIEDLTGPRTFQTAVEHLTGTTYPKSVCSFATRVSTVVNNSHDRREHTRVTVPSVTVEQVVEQLDGHRLQGELEERRAHYGYV